MAETEAVTVWTAHVIELAPIIDGRRTALEWSGTKPQEGELLKFVDDGTQEYAMARITHVFDSYFEGIWVLSFVLDDDRHRPPTYEQMQRARAAAEEWNACDPPTQIPPDAVRAIVEAAVGACPNE